MVLLSMMLTSLCWFCFFPLHRKILLSALTKESSIELVNEIDMVEKAIKRMSQAQGKRRGPPPGLGITSVPPFLANTGSSQVDSAVGTSFSMSAPPPLEPLVVDDFQPLVSSVVLPVATAAGGGLQSVLSTSSSTSTVVCASYSTQHVIASPCSVTSSVAGSASSTGTGEGNFDTYTGVSPTDNSQLQHVKLPSHDGLRLGRGKTIGRGTRALVTINDIAKQHAAVGGLQLAESERTEVPLPVTSPTATSSSNSPPPPSAPYTSLVSSKTVATLSNGGCNNRLQSDAKTFRPSESVLQKLQSAMNQVSVNDEDTDLIVRPSSLNTNNQAGWSTETFAAPSSDSALSVGRTNSCSSGAEDLVPELSPLSTLPPADPLPAGYNHSQAIAEAQRLATSMPPHPNLPLPSHSPLFVNQGRLLNWPHANHPPPGYSPRLPLSLPGPGPGPGRPLVPAPIPPTPAASMDLSVGPSGPAAYPGSEAPMVRVQQTFHQQAVLSASMISPGSSMNAVSIPSTPYIVQQTQHTAQYVHPATVPPRGLAYLRNPNMLVEGSEQWYIPPPLPAISLQNRGFTQALGMCHQATHLPQPPLSASPFQRDAPLFATRDTGRSVPPGL